MTPYRCLQHFIVTVNGCVHVTVLRAAPLLLRRSGPLSQLLLCQCCKVCFCIVNAMVYGIAIDSPALRLPLSSSHRPPCKESSGSSAGLVP